jgi:hypothetical protein
MPYFFVLPIFILTIAGLSTASVIAACVPRLRPALPFLWRVLLWSSPGFLLANIPVLCLDFVPLLLERTNFTPPEGSPRSFLTLALSRPAQRMDSTEPTV